MATEWDADVVEDVPDEKVTWRAVDGRESGEVRSEKLAGDMTKVTYQLKYTRRLGKAKPTACAVG